MPYAALPLTVLPHAVLPAVAFVQMLKAFTPVTTMLCGFMFGLERASAKMIAAVSCICLGVVVSSYGEVNFSWFGVVAMLTSVGSEGLRLVMMQHLLAAKQFHPLEAWMYLAPACTIWLVLLIGVFEIHHINDQHGLDIIVQHHWYFVFAALAGFAVNTLAMLVIKLASALTLKVLGICKDIGLVMAGVMLLGEHVTMLQVAGYSVSLLGCSCYNYIKAMGIGSQQLQVQQETCQNKQQQQQQGGKLGDSNKSHRSSSSSRLKHGLIGRAPMRSTGLQDPLLPKAMPPPPPNSKAHS
jgi:drug/metabolite transporter (DMT)-like permease